MSNIEYDEKRDKFYLTLLDDDKVEYAIYPSHMEELCQNIQDALYLRREIIDRNGVRTEAAR